jgi:hypothetical protein
MALSAPQVVPTPALQVAPAPRVITSQLGAGSKGGIDPLFHTNAATYLGGTLVDAYTRIKSTSTGLVVAGFSGATSNPTGIDLAVAEVSNTLTSATVAHIDFGTGVKFYGRGLEVGSDGTIYVTGFTGQNAMNVSGTSNFYVLSIRSDLTAVNWALFFSTRSAGYGLRLDAAGTNLYVTGDYDLSGVGFPADNLLIIKLTNLHASTPTTVYSSVFIFADGMGHPTPSLGNGVGPDSHGNADVVGNYTLGSNVEPLEGQINPAGNAFLDARFFPSVGPQGKGLDITVDSTDTYFISGSFNTVNGDPGTSFFNAKFSPVGTEAWDFEWMMTTNNGNIALNSFATGIRTDSLGYVYDSVSEVDPTSSSTSNVTLDAFKFSATGGGFIDGTVGAIGGSRYDYGLGIDVAAGNNPVYLVGATSSPDFPVTPGVVQTTYGGGSFDGVILSLTMGI